jgi:hypothetical protein
MSNIALTPNASGTGVFTIASPNSNTNRTLTLPDATGTVNVSGLANEVPAGSAGAPAIYSTGDTNTGIYFPAADTIAFSEGGSESMRIDSSGNLSVGPTIGLARINTSADGASQAGLNVYDTAGGSTAYSCVNFIRNGSAVGFISTTNLGTTYSITSDYRLKENVQPMQGALAKIAQLNPVTYTWKVDGSDGQGFIAHELQAVIPDCVTGDKDAVDAEGNPKYQGIDTSFLVATLVAATKEQQAIITALAARITALEAAQ